MHELFHLVSLFLPIGFYTIGEAPEVAPFIQWQEKQLVHASMFRVGRKLMITLDCITSPLLII